MSMPSLALRVSFLIQICFPVEATSANADVSVAPKTVPSATVTPLGPSSGELYFVVHRTLPLCRLIASTSELRSCVYITPPEMTGVVAYPPNCPVAVIGSVQATPSVETFDALIGPPTSRVFCRSAPGELHVAESELGGAAGLGGRAGVLSVLWPLPQAATRQLVVTSKIAA